MAKLPRVLPRMCGRIYLRRKYILSFIVFFSIPLLYIQLTFPVRYLFRNANITQACIIPKPNPWDSSILKHVWDLPPLVCDTSPAIIYLDDSGLVQFNLTALRMLKLKKSGVKCQYKILKRHPYDEKVTFTSAVPLTPPVKVGADLFHVTCKADNDKQVFDEQFASVSRRNSTRLQKETKDQLSVLMFAIDSVSRSQSIRKLPKTVKYLKEQLKAYDFQGAMKVGENTLPNVVPLLTGRRAWSRELPVLDYAAQPYDSFPFIWKDYARRGYATLYAEDLPEFATFLYRTKGFKDPPTDHYMMPFWQGLYVVDMINSNMSPVFQFLEDKHLHLQSKSSLCYGRKAKHNIQMEYLKHYFREYKGDRKFAFSFINEICHDYQNFLGYGDNDFMLFLKWLKEEGHLDNTVLVFFSDHGARIDKIRNTFVGRIEDRMPMLYVVLPEHIKRSFPELDKSMETNTMRLNTLFDVHQTLKDVVSQNFESPTKLYVDGSLRGISLFQPLPSHRSCEDAWIPESYCACYSSSQVNITQDRSVRSIAAAILDQLNSRLSGVPACSQLTLLKIQDAERITLGLQHSGTENTGVSLFQFFRPENKPSHRYLVVIETMPGHGEFEGTADISSDTGSVSVVGDIVRVNRYGNQGQCIQDKRIRPLCYCEDNKA